VHAVLGPFGAEAGPGLDALLAFDAEPDQGPGLATDLDRLRLGGLLRCSTSISPSLSL